MSAAPDETAQNNAAIAAVPATAANGMLSQRIHYLDNLRAMAMLLGVFLHAALAYAQPAQTFWLATDPQASVAIDASIWFIHLFRMGLFFLLSGYFAKLVVQRKGVKHFLRNRLLRILLPFIVFYPILMVAMTLVIAFAMSYIEEPQGLMGFIVELTQNAKDNPNSEIQRPLSTLHLWFLYYLLAFSIGAAFMSNVKRFKLDALLHNPKYLILLPLLLVPGAMAGGSPLPAPESFIPTWWPFAFYGLFYFAGWQLFGREKLLDSCKPYLCHIAVVCLAMFAIYYLLMPTMDLAAIAEGQPPQRFWIRVVEACLTAYLSVLLTLAALLLGKQFLASRNAVLGFVADSSYWTYLIHLPIVILLQTLLISVELPLWLKLFIVVVGTMLPCMLSYAVCVRYTPLGWLLHGKRSNRLRQAVVASTLTGNGV